MKFLLIGIGGFLGANARYLVEVLVNKNYFGQFPLSTLLINLSGSFLLPLFLMLVAERAPFDAHTRFLFVAGFLGAYTTFSTFSIETLRLIENGAWLIAVGNVLANVVFCILGVWLGVLLTRLMAGPHITF